MVEGEAQVKFRTVKRGEVFTESILATEVGRNRYRLQSIPRYADDVSLGDIVATATVNGQPEFKKVIEKTGRRTLRVIFEEDIREGNEADKTLKGLASFGCHSVEIDSRHFAVNIPPSMKFEAVTQFLEDGYTEWEHADPSQDTLYPTAVKKLRKLAKKMFNWR